MILSQKRFRSRWFQERIGEIIDPEFQLPKKANSAFQPNGSNHGG